MSVCEAVRGGARCEFQHPGRHQGRQLTSVHAQKIILMTPNCLPPVIFEVTRCETGLFSREQSAQWQRICPFHPRTGKETQDRRALIISYFCQPAWVPGLFFGFTRAWMGCSSLQNNNPGSFGSFKGGLCHRWRWRKQSLFRRNSKWNSDIKEKWENLIMFLISSRVRFLPHSSVCVSQFLDPGGCQICIVNKSADPFKQRRAAFCGASE